MEKSFALKGNICHTINPGKLELYPNSYVVCIDGVSHGIFEELPEKFKKIDVYDYEDKIIMPGMVDLHIHAPQYAFRGMCMDLELMEWLKKYTFPEEEKHADLIYSKKTYSIFAESMKKSATTRACIFATRHREATEILMNLMEETGLITYVGKVNMDRGATPELNEENAEVSAEETLRWLEETKFKYERTKPILTPRFTPSCTDELMEKLRFIQMQYDLPVQSHLSESKGEIEFVKYLHPNINFYAQTYDEHELFGRNRTNQSDFKTIMAHCVWSVEEEIELMVKNGVFVAHCPASNMNLTSGIAPIRKYLDKGMNVGLGTDVAGGHSESVFSAIVDAIQSSKIYYRMVNESFLPITFSEAFYMATKGGGKFFGNVGSFEKEYEFDAVVIDDNVFSHPQEITLAERVERVVYLMADRNCIVAKYVAGKRI